MTTILGRATINLPGDATAGEGDLTPNQVVEIDSEHPYVKGGWIIPLEVELHDRRVPELQEIAKTLGIEGTSSMNKSDLVDAIKAAEASDAEPVDPAE